MGEVGGASPTTSANHALAKGNSKLWLETLQQCGQYILYGAAWRKGLQSFNPISFKFSRCQRAPHCRSWWWTRRRHLSIREPSSEQIFLLFERVQSTILPKCFKDFSSFIFPGGCRPLQVLGRKFRECIVQFEVKARS